MERTFPSISTLARVLRSVIVFLIGLTAFASAGRGAQFTLTWSDNSSNESGFRIERATGAGAYAEIATVGANVVSYVDTGLPNSTAFSYRVRAYNGAGNSGYSNVASASTPPLQSNTAPTISNIANISIAASGTSAAIAVLVDDAETNAASLTLTASSSNTTLIPTSGITFGGTGANRTVTIRPASGRTGSATVTVTVSDGTTSTSDSFVVTVNALVISAQPQAATIVPGTGFTLSVTAAGASTMTYQWYRDGVAIAGATSATYSIPLAQRSDAGSYYVVVSSGSTSVTSSTVVVPASTVASTGILANLSARASVQGGDGLLIPGFVIAGSGSKSVLLRMVGPGLASSGLTGLLPDPKIVLKRQTDSGYVDAATNLDWTDSGATALTQAFLSVGAFSLTPGSNDAALLVDLTSGVYSVAATDEQEGRTGIAIVEIYDADTGASSARLTNLSARGYLGTGNNVMIAGFVVEDGPVNVLLRCVGPGLASYNVNGAIRDPQLRLTRRIDNADELVLVNDNWGSGPDPAYTAQVTTQVSASGLASGSLDAAVVATLPPGVYTLICQGSGTSTGIGLAEVYIVP